MSDKWWVNAAKVILFFEITKSFLPNIEEFILRLLWALWQVLIRLQVLFGLRDHFATTVAHLLPSCIIAVALCFHLSVFLTPLYIIVVLNTQRFGILCQRLWYILHVTCWIAKKRGGVLNWPLLSKLQRTLRSLTNTNFEIMRITISFKIGAIKVQIVLRK